MLQNLFFAIFLVGLALTADGCDSKPNPKAKPAPTPATQTTLLFHYDGTAVIETKQADGSVSYNEPETEVAK